MFLAIVGFGEAARISKHEMASEAIRFRQLTSLFVDNLTTQAGNILLNGHPTERLPGNLNLSVPGCESKALIVSLKDVAISTGSACTSLSVEPSHVLLSLGYGEERAHNAIRIGIGRMNSDNEIKVAAQKISAAVRELRSVSKFAMC